MMGVKEIPKVQTIDHIFSILLCDLQVYQSPSLHSLQAAHSPSLHSLQQPSLLHFILNGPYNGAPHSFQIPLVE